MITANIQCSLLSYKTMHSVHYHHDNHAQCPLLSHQTCTMSPTFASNIYNFPTFTSNMYNVPYLHVKHVQCPLPSRQAWRMSLTFTSSMQNVPYVRIKHCTMSHPHVPDSHHHNFCGQQVVSSFHPWSSRSPQPFPPLQHTRHITIHPPSQAPVVSVTMGCWDRYLANMNQHWATRDLGHWHWYLADMDQRWTAGTSAWPT